ncbi:MAG: NYN domain-containing protein [Terrimicrobiaceae bacterium]
MKARVLIVDGHSIIFQWPELAAKHAGNRLAARESLVKSMTALQDGSDWHVVVVFDGRQARAGEASEPGGIQIFYSANGQTADSVIERLVAKYSQTYDVTVATDDHMERTTVQSFGGRAISSLQLRDEMELAGAELAGRIKRLGRESGRR